MRLSDKEECSTWSVRHGNGKQDTRFVLTESVSLISLSAFFSSVLLYSVSRIW